jgi:uncharacterized protein YggU (UPF0235/DUF167 family)
MKKKPTQQVEARVSVRVTPRAARNEAVAFADSLLTLRLTAPPVDGAANEACCEYVAELLGVAKSLVSVAAGGHSRNKVVAITGLSSDEVSRRLTAAVARAEA